MDVWFQVDVAKVSGNNITKKKYHIDTTALHFPKKGMELNSFLKDGMIEDWDMFEQVFMLLNFFNIHQPFESYVIKLLHM